MDEWQVETTRLDAEAERLAQEGKTVNFIARGGRLAGLISMADVVRPTSRAAVADLRQLGIEPVMITGDNWGVGRAVAKDVGIDTVLAEVLPEHKAAEVAKLQRQNKIVAMVGDGINDAPALAQADVGIAIGAGTDVAIESADVVLIKNDVFDVSRAVRLSRATMRNIKQNLFFAFIYNGVGIPIAAGVLYPFFGLLLSPMIAAGAMAASSISVVMNALRLRTFEMPASVADAEPVTFRREDRAEGTPAMPLPTEETEAATKHTVTDPVCGMDINPDHAAGHSEYQGATYSFCSASCKQQFDQDPEHYVRQQAVR
jgi:Cu+-exporting ATPase